MFEFFFGSSSSKPESEDLRSDQSDAAINTRSQYQLVKKLGKFKHHIYVAENAKSQTKCVAKIYTHDSNGKNQYFFKNEQSFAEFDHPNIVSIIDTEEDRLLNLDGNVQKSSVVYLEHAPYGDLFCAVIAKGIRFDEKLVRSYFHQLVDGLTAMHKKGCAHLDIKLDNLLFGKDYRLKIADFDLSYNPGVSRSQPSRGTANYRAPELRKGKAKDFTLCDVYSAGVVLFALYSGTFPFVEHGESVSSDQLIYKLYLVLSKYPLEFWKRQCKLQDKEGDFWSEDFKELFEGMCQYDSSKRFTLEQVKESRWFNGPVYTNQEIEKIMKEHL